MSTVHFSKSFETLVSVYNAGGMTGAGVVELKVGDVLTLPEDFSPNPEKKYVKSEQVLSFMEHAPVTSLTASSRLPKSVVVFTQIVGWDDDLFPEGYGDLFGGFDLPESTMQAGGTYKVKEILKTEVAEDIQWDIDEIRKSGVIPPELESFTREVVFEDAAGKTFNMPSGLALQKGALLNDELAIEVLKRRALAH